MFVLSVLLHASFGSWGVVCSHVQAALSSRWDWESWAGSVDTSASKRATQLCLQQAPGQRLWLSSRASWVKSIFWSLRNSLCPCISHMFYLSILEVLPGAWLLDGSLCLKQSGREGRLWVWYLKVALIGKGAWSVIVAPNCYWLAWGLMLKWWGVLTWQIIH